MPKSMDLSSRGSWFESLSGYQLFWLSFSVPFVSTSSRVPIQCFKQATATSFQALTPLSNDIILPMSLDVI